MDIMAGDGSHTLGFRGSRPTSERCMAHRARRRWHPPGLAPRTTQDHWSYIQYRLKPAMRRQRGASQPGEPSYPCGQDRAVDAAVGRAATVTPRPGIEVGM
jgi:hypothetical protein